MGWYPKHIHNIGNKKRIKYCNLQNMDRPSEYYAEWNNTYKDKYCMVSPTRGS